MKKNIFEIPHNHYISLVVGAYTFSSLEETKVISWRIFFEISNLVTDLICYMYLNIPTLQFFLKQKIAAF